MKNLDKIVSLLGEPIKTKDFELLHQIKLLKKELTEKDRAYRQMKADKESAETKLNTSIGQILNQNRKVLEFKTNQLKQITDSMTSSMCYMDQDYVYRYVNNKYQEWYGVSNEDILGKSVKEVSSFLYENFKSVYDSVMAGNPHTYTLETEIPTGGKKVFFNTYIPAYNIEGKNIGLYIYATDITENHKITKQLEKSRKEITQKNKTLQQYIESNVQLEQFAHIAAHDMKAPLRTIASFTGIIEKKLAQTLSEKEKEYFNFIKEGTVSLSNMITDLLNYSKIKSEGIVIQEIELKELLDSVVKYLDLTIEDNNAQLVVEDMPRVIHADRIKLYQVFQNLICNAIKFKKEDTPPVINIKYSETPDFYQFTVSDNGIGIPEEKQNVIFDPFKQLNTKQKFNGTGLGLSICKRIISDHHGTISAENNQSGGSRFDFSISKNLVP